MSARLSAGSLIFYRLRTDIAHQWRRPRLGGFELPPPAGARLAHRLAAEVHIFKGGGGSSCIVIAQGGVIRLAVLFASYGRVALVGLLRPVCCRARHSARPSGCVPCSLWSLGSLPLGALATLGTSVVANAPFFSAGARCCGSGLHGFPLARSLARFAPCSPAPIARRQESFWRGLMPPAPPSITADDLLLYRHRGRCPRQPLPAERARGRGVFHSILGLRPNRPKWAF